MMLRRRAPSSATWSLALSARCFCRHQQSARASSISRCMHKLGSEAQAGQQVKCSKQAANARRCCCRTAQTPDIAEVADVRMCHGNLLSEL